ncbi:hypothetical protein ACFL7M_01335 [Thermodesulfobacteriota bacterium]
MDIWEAYKLGFKLNLRKNGGTKPLLRLVYHPPLLAHWLTPIDFVRYREFDFAFKAIKQYGPNPDSILDLSSPKLFPLTIAHTYPEADVHSVDILNHEATSGFAAAKILGINNFKVMVQDARFLGCESDRFEVVTSLSVFEHIAPEKNGDILAAKELGRVINQGGIAVVTVPFAKSYFAEYKAGTVYERTSDKGGKIFFQRFYDYNLLSNNIIKPSGLKVIYMRFIEERCFKTNPHKRLAQIINSSTKQNVLFGPFFFILSKIFLTNPRLLGNCTKPYIACLVLEKR